MENVENTEVEKFYQKSRIVNEIRKIMDKNRFDNTIGINWYPMWKKTIRTPTLKMEKYIKKTWNV